MNRKIFTFKKFEDVKTPNYLITILTENKILTNTYIKKKKDDILWYEGQSVGFIVIMFQE